MQKATKAKGNGKGQRQRQRQRAKAKVKGKDKMFLATKNETMKKRKMSGKKEKKEPIENITRVRSVTPAHVREKK